MGSADADRGSAPRNGAAAPPRREPAAIGPRRRNARSFLETPSLPGWTLVLDLVALATLYLVGRLTPFRLALAHLGLLSFATFVVFGVDKWRAQKERRRVSEANLLLLAAAGGALGALAAMPLFRHKTQRPLFMVLVPTFAFIHGVVLALAFLR